MPEPAKKAAAKTTPATARTDAGGRPVNPNDDMQLEVVDENDTLGLDNAIRNADAQDANENTRR